MTHNTEQFINCETNTIETNFVTIIDNDYIEPAHENIEVTRDKFISIINNVDNSDYYNDYYVNNDDNIIKKPCINCESKCTQKKYFIFFSALIISTYIFLCQYYDKYINSELNLIFILLFMMIGCLYCGLFVCG
jgi:hypothetical protein